MLEVSFRCRKRRERRRERGISKRSFGVRKCSESVFSVKQVSSRAWCRVIDAEKRRCWAESKRSEGYATGFTRGVIRGVEEEERRGRE